MGVVFEEEETVREKELIGQLEKREGQEWRRKKACK
jgi:hypothetical protein